MHVTSDQGGGGAKEGNQIPHQEIVGSPKRDLSLPPLIPDFHLKLYNAPQSDSRSCSTAQFPKSTVKMCAYHVGVKGKINTLACKSKIQK